MIPLARHHVGDEELDACRRVLSSGRLVLGDENLQFEKGLAAAADRRHAVCVSSGTVALELALWALGVGRGDEVLLPAFGFPSAAHAVLRAGATPVVVDVDASSWNLCLKQAERVVSRSCRALVSIDQFGVVADTFAVGDFARRHQLKVLADSACALGSRDKSGVAGGGYGDFGILSFHPRKIITTGEGGALLCDDSGLEQSARVLRNLGQRQAGGFCRVGSNARMPELSAALGRCQLARLDDYLAQRRSLAAGYKERLRHLREGGKVSWQEIPEGAEPNFQTFAIKLSEPYQRDAVQEGLRQRGIQSGPATYALHRSPDLAAKMSVGEVSTADALHDRGLALPLYIGMTAADLDRVSESLGEVLA